jgi:hypothetical protein
MIRNFFRDSATNQIPVFDVDNGSVVWLGLGLGLGFGIWDLGLGLGLGLGLWVGGWGLGLGVVETRHALSLR